MDIRCPSCNKLFRVADEKIAGKGIRFKCSKCAEIVTITRDDFEMDLLAREAEATEPIPRQPEPATRPSPPLTPEPSLKTAPVQPMPSPEPEAREYKPPQEQEQDIPPASLSDFDFSEPHAAAMAAADAHADFGGHDFSFNVEPEPEQDAAPVLDISPEAAAEAEAALQFPDDLISEPARKPMFGTPSGGELTPDEGSGQQPEGGPAFTPPGSEPSPDLQAEEELDLGAALAMPKDTTDGPKPAAAEQKAAPAAGPAMSKGPVITPDLLAEMMKRSTTSGKSAAQAKPAPPADREVDLGAALAMPKAAEAPGREEAGARPAAASATRGVEGSSLGKGALVFAVVALVLVAVLAALYYLGFLGGKNEQEALQKQQPASQQRSQPARQVITPEGLLIVEPAAFVDPARGDLVITGRIQNTTDKPAPGWYLVTEVRDSNERVLVTVQMMNGTQIYSKAEQEILVKRGMKIDELEKKLASPEAGTISPKGSVSFEIRVVNPPAGSARFLPTLQAFDPSSLIESIKAAQGHP